MKILLVDDSQTIIHILKKMLTELGYDSIDGVNDGEQARLKIRSEMYDLIISDWNMPGGSGLDLLKFVRSDVNTARIPFILLTSDQDKSKIFQAKQYNPQFYLLKPLKKWFLAERLSILAKTHGIEPPAGIDSLPQTDLSGITDSVQRTPSTHPKAGFASESTGKSSENVAKILKQCTFLLSGRKTAMEFRTFLGKEIFNFAPEDIKMHHIHDLSGTLYSILQQQLYSIFENDSDT